MALLKLYLEYDQTDKFCDSEIPVEEERRFHENEIPDEKEDYGKYDEVGAAEVEPDCEEKLEEVEVEAEEDYGSVKSIGNMKGQNGINYFDYLPVELIEKILMYAMGQSKHM